MTNRNVRESTLMPPLFITEQQSMLLANAELHVTETYCQHHCVHHRPFQACYECPKFEVPFAGYIECDGYEPAGDGETE